METTVVGAIRANVQQVLERIERTARDAGRDPDGIRLVVVTKGHPLEAVQAAVDAGLRIFGENYAEEGVQKLTALTSLSLEWHMIGHVQSRKARLVAAHFDCVHSIDSFKLARRLDAEAAGTGRRLPVLLECNVSGESSKFGWPAWNEDQWPDLVPAVAEVNALPNLEVCGLMTMAPFFDLAEAARPFFHQLGRLQHFLLKELPDLRLPELSMGMSGDYQAAIQEGATLVRIGTAIMGPRPDPIRDVV